MNNPVISICCITYNHEQYIRQCLDGFINQKTTFPFEILVHDDASTDHNASIIREYEAKHPDLFRCVYQTVNQFAFQNSLTNILFKMAKGKYIALCEGDDYWSDPLKLQKQVDWMEENPMYSFTGHQTSILSDGQFRLISPKCLGEVKLKQGVSQFITQTSSIVFKRSLLDDFPSYFHKCPVGDSAMICIFLSKGPGYIFDDVMSVYRAHNGGIHTGAQLYQNQMIALRTQLWKMRYYPVNLWKQMEKAFIILWHIRAKGKNLRTTLKSLNSIEYLLTVFTLVIMTPANIFLRKQRRVGY